MSCVYSDNGAPSLGSGELTALQLFNNKYPSPGSQKSTRSAPAKDSAPSLSSQKSTSPELPNDSHLRSGSQRSMRSAPISNVFGTRCIRRLNVQEGDLLQDLYAWGTRVDDWIGTITPHPPSMDDDVDAITPAPPLSHSQGSNASSSETKITDPNANKKPSLPGSSLPNDAIDSEKKHKPGNTNTLGATQPKVETTNNVQPPNEPADVKKRKNL